MSSQPRPGIDGPVTGEEPDFLANLPIDNVVGALIALAGEVAVLRERVQVLEAELESRHVLTPGAIEHREGTPDEQRRRQEDLAAYVQRFMAELTRDRTPTSRIDPAVAPLLQAGKQARP